MKEKIKRVKKIFKEYRPDKNSTETGRGEKLAWKIKPKKDHTEVKLRFDKEFEQDDVTITVRIGSEVNYFNSPSGMKDVIKSASFGATKRF
jgi:helix-turn-helix protein